jgi:hypothetical protein
MIHLEREEIKLYCYSCNKLFKSLNLYKTHKRNVHNKKSKGNKCNKKNKIILNSNDNNNLKDTNISTETFESTGKMSPLTSSIIYLLSVLSGICSVILFTILKYFTTDGFTVLKI